MTSLFKLKSLIKSTTEWIESIVSTYWYLCCYVTARNDVTSWKMMSWNGLYKEFIIQKTNKESIGKPIQLLLKKSIGNEYNYIFCLKHFDYLIEKSRKNLYIVKKKAFFILKSNAPMC